MTAVNWVTLIIGMIGGLTGCGSLVAAVMGRGKTRAEASQIIAGTAVTMMREMEEDAKAAQLELRQVRLEARALADELHRLRMAIMAPSATVETLRLLVVGPASNGQVS